MLPTGHIAASVIIAKVPELFGYHVSGEDLMTIILFGVLPDFDIAFPFLKRDRRTSHRSYVSHTPFGVLTLWFLIFILFKDKVTSILLFQLLAAILGHIVLDSLAYWLTLLKVQNVVDKPQINWLYPFRKYKITNSTDSYTEGVERYIKKAKVSLYIEVGMIIIAAVSLLRS